jgi:hypothetical protein
MKKLFIGAAAAAVLTLPSVAAVMHAPLANACPPGMSLQNQSPLLGPQCAPNQNNNLFPKPGQQYGPPQRQAPPPTICPIKSC